ncbi:MAG: PBP1A family penicillin-binding protein [Chthonomonadales bacterium]
MSKRVASIAARRRAARRPPTLKKRLKNFAALLALIILTGVAVLAVYLVLIFIEVSRNLPSVDEINNMQPTQGTQIFFADGTQMAVIGAENRQPVKLDAISKHLIDATIAVEDSRFFEHRGIDLRSILRAAYRDAVGGDVREGASTITQQLARNISALGLTRRKLLRRKIAEAMLAVRIEQSFTKDEILELYLNRIYYGNGAYGAEAAAEAYFHKHAKDLTLAEAAWLAGLPQRPAYYSAPAHRDQSLRRRDTVLERMVETGKITPEERDAATAEPLHIFKAQPSGSRIYAAPYVVNYVVHQLTQYYGPDAIYNGMKVYTTLDPRIQKIAEQTLADGVRRSGVANQGALICIDNRTGFIRAMVGGLDYQRDQFNVVVQGVRQPGSCFKPIVYTAALDTGKVTLDTRYRDDPSLPGEHAGNKWHPKNYSGRYSYRRITVLDAIKHSINTVAVKVAMDTGLDTVIAYARKMGITTPLAPYAPLALGASGVRPIELCEAYTVFATNGKRAVPQCLKATRTSADDPVDEWAPRLEDVGFQSHTLSDMNEALREVVLHGTGTMAADVPNAHGKTGTTSDSRDAWFAGYTPELTTVVWVAHENRMRSGRLNPKEPYLPMPGATGGHLCAPIWRDFMLKAVPIQMQANQSLNAPAQSAPQLHPSPQRTAAENITARSATPARASQGAIMPPSPQPPSDAAVPIAPTDQRNAAASGIPVEPLHSAPAIMPAPALPVPATAPPPNAAPRATQPVSSRPAEPIARPTLPAPRVDPQDEMVTVRLCADTMKRATPWCPVTIERRMRRRDIPGRCRLHKPPPGEG